eukprot:3223904-Rhodomonas_salina.9
MAGQCERDDQVQVECGLLEAAQAGRQVHARAQEGSSDVMAVGGRDVRVAGCGLRVAGRGGGRRGLRMLGLG